MATGDTNPQANPDSTPPVTRALAVWGRPLAVVTAVVFLICALFPVVAGLSKNTAAFPRWWGPLDVGISFVLALLSLVVMALAQGHVDRKADDASYRAYRILIHGIFAVLVAFFLCGDRIVWSQCLTGIAWRSWLLLYALPAWFTALRAGASCDLGITRGQE
jgi:hypothetical protein